MRNDLSQGSSSVNGDASSDTPDVVVVCVGSAGLFLTAASGLLGEGVEHRVIQVNNGDAGLSDTGV